MIHQPPIFRYRTGAVRRQDVEANENENIGSKTLSLKATSTRSLQSTPSEWFSVSANLRRG